jgi:hypothetical protein
VIQIQSNEKQLNLIGVDQQMVDFISLHSYLEVSMEEFKNGFLNSRGVHNHTLENLFLYFDLEKHLSKNRVVFYPCGVLIVDNRKHKFFIYDNEEFLLWFDFTGMDPEFLTKKLICYSSVPQIDARFTNEKLKEFVYNLEEVFDERTYFEKYKDRTVKEIKKKIYNKILYPFIFLHKQNFRSEDITEEHLPQILTLHKEWCDKKLADPRTFQMMFSTNRYNRCIERMFNSEYLKRNQFYAKAFYLDDKLIGVRQCLVVGDRGYDIGNFSAFWEIPSQMGLYLNIWALKDMKDNYGIKTFNCGMALNASLSLSKHHFPGTDLVTYKQKFIK